MTTSTRYKFVKNALGVPLTIANFPVTNDGDDRQTKTVKRVLSAADIGTAAGQIGNASGCIVDVIPSGYNVLWVEGLTWRPLTAVGGAKPYMLMDNNVIAATIVEIEYMLGLDNTIRAIDVGQGGGSALAIGDIITVKLTIGAAQDTLDSMN